MPSRISGIGSLAAIAALSSLLVATPALAAWPGAADPAPSAGPSGGLQLAYQKCGHNFRRSPNGSCDPIVDANRDCQDGFHAVPAPNAAGYRCVQDGY